MQTSLQKWEEQAAQQGDPLAQLNLAPVQIWGTDLPQALPSLQQKNLPSGRYIVPLAPEHLGSGRYHWEWDLHIAEHAQVFLMFVPPTSQAPVTLQMSGQITLGEGSRCHMSYAGRSCVTRISSQIHYHLGKRSGLKARYLLNHRGLEDFREKFYLNSHAALDIKALVHGSGLDFKIFQPRVEHLQPHSRSETNVRSMVGGRAQAYVSGMIAVEPGASCDAHYHNKNLLLSHKAFVEAEPQLAIFFDDLGCSHGVALGPLDPEQIFYLCARGLSFSAAQKLVLQAFSAAVLQDFSPEVQEALQSFYEHDMLEHL